jgi:hypothetical protein
MQVKVNDEKRKQKAIQKNVKELQKLGFSVRITPTE